ncbi:MAG: GNAT family N-acetyltransferase, partial [Thermoanaerobaculia bacterium]
MRAVPGARAAATGDAQRHGVAAEPLALGVVSHLDEFLAMEDAWNDLLEKSPQRGQPMLSHEWFRAWWEAFGSDKELFVLTLRAGDRLIGIAPLMRARVSYHGLPVRLLSLITNDHTNRADLIIAERPEACVDLVLDFARRTASCWDLAQFDFLPVESLTTRAIRARA